MGPHPPHTHTHQTAGVSENKLRSKMACDADHSFLTQPTFPSPTSHDTNLPLSLTVVEMGTTPRWS